MSTAASGDCHDVVSPSAHPLPTSVTVSVRDKQAMLHIALSLSLFTSPDTPQGAFSLPPIFSSDFLPSQVCHR